MNGTRARGPKPKIRFSRTGTLCLGHTAKRSKARGPTAAALKVLLLPRAHAYQTQKNGGPAALNPTAYGTRDWRTKVDAKRIHARLSPPPRGGDPAQEDEAAEAKLGSGLAVAKRGRPPQRGPECASAKEGIYRPVSNGPVAEHGPRPVCAPTPPRQAPTPGTPTEGEHATHACVQAETACERYAGKCNARKLGRYAVACLPLVLGHALPLRRHAQSAGGRQHLPSPSVYPRRTGLTCPICPLL